MTKKCKTVECNNKINNKARHDYCTTCQKRGKNKPNGCNITENTLGDYRSRDVKKAATYAPIREHARKVMKEYHNPKCIICGYSRHVDACHVKDIKDFVDEVLISEINHPSNVVPLCKNHHWEFDKKELDENDLNTILEYTKGYADIKIIIVGEDLLTNECIDCRANISESAMRCRYCNNVNKNKLNSRKDIPSYTILIEEVAESNYSAVGRKYNVSGNAIKKRIKKKTP